MRVARGSLCPHNPGDLQETQNPSFTYFLSCMESVVQHEYSWVIVQNMDTNVQYKEEYNILNKELKVITK